MVKEIIITTLDDSLVELAYDLISQYLPENATLTITETDGNMISRFLVRVSYKSHRTGRSVSILAKGDSLPNAEDECLRYYVSQLARSPQEVNRLFSSIAWREKRARQEAWLAAGKLSNERVTSQEIQEDMIPLPYNEQGSTLGEGSY